MRKDSGRELWEWGVELQYLDASLEELIERAERRHASGDWTASPMTPGHFERRATIVQPPDEKEIQLFEKPLPKVDLVELVPSAIGGRPEVLDCPGDWGTLKPRCRGLVLPSSGGVARALDLHSSPRRHRVTRRAGPPFDGRAAHWSR